MNTPNTPSLPELPEPTKRLANAEGWPLPKTDFYTADQMREYGERCALAARSLPAPAEPVVPDDVIAAIQAYGDARADDGNGAAGMAEAILAARRWAARLTRPVGDAELQTGRLSPDYCKGFADGQATLRPGETAWCAGRWEAMETAPLGPLVLLACTDWNPNPEATPIKVGGWWDNHWHVFGASWKPTHWMPLPPAPHADGGGE